MILAVALVTSCIGITAVLIDKQVGTVYQFASFYAQDRDTVDVLCVGSSRVHNNINPTTLWTEYGIASYDLGLNSQSIDTSYWALKEAFKTQHPKVVVVEVSQEAENEVAVGMPSVYGMRFNENYIGAITERRGFSDAMAYLLTFPCYHSRYDMVDKESYIEDRYACYPTSGAKGYKGAVEYFHKVTMDPFPSEVNHIGEKYDERRLGYFDRIVNLCQKEGSELLFVFTPSAGRDGSAGMLDYSANHPEVAYINFNEHLEEMGMDPANDFIEIGHLNRYGSEKVSRYLGKYLKANYDIPDRRGDAAYVSWDENAEYYRQKEIDNAIVKETGLGLYFDYFPNENYLLIVSLLGDYDSTFVGQQDVLRCVCCDDTIYMMGGTWVLDGTQTLYYIPGREDVAAQFGISGPDITTLNWHKDIGDRTFALSGCGAERRILIDNVNYAVKKPNSDNLVSDGIEIIVYDKLAQKVVDAVAFDSVREWAITRDERR